MYNTILYWGLGLMAVGFVGFIISIIMERHYEVKLWELEQKRNGNKYMCFWDTLLERYTTCINPMITHKRKVS